MWVGDRDTKIYIYRREDAGFEFELTELDGVDIEQIYDELLCVHGVSLPGSLV